MCDEITLRVKELLFAILRRAMNDMDGIDVGYDERTKAKLKKEAYNYLTSNSMEIFSAKWIAQHLIEDTEIWRNVGYSAKKRILICLSDYGDN